MATIIDGYNVLYVVGLLSRRIAPGTLERARKALLHFVVATTDVEQRKRTTVVFDANDPPPGAQSVFEFKGITVRFAVRHSSADALIEELIYRESAPRSLEVVSSDHRIQQVAKRRRARAIDSDTWYDQQQRLRPNTAPIEIVEEPQRYQGTDTSQVDFWLATFGMPPSNQGESSRSFQGDSAALTDSQPTSAARPAPAPTPTATQPPTGLSPAAQQSTTTESIPSTLSPSSQPTGKFLQRDTKAADRNPFPLSPSGNAARKPSPRGSASETPSRRVPHKPIDLAAASWDDVAQPFPPDYLAECAALIEKLEQTNEPLQGGLTGLQPKLDSHVAKKNDRIP